MLLSAIDLIVVLCLAAQFAIAAYFLCLLYWLGDTAGPFVLSTISVEAIHPPERPPSTATSTCSATSFMLRCIRGRA